jgi:hypothetical protein
VVHEDFGDRNASDIELGYNTTEKGLVAYWPIDENSGSTATDVAGSNDGTIKNDTTLDAEGILNSTSYSFAGDNEYVQVPDSSALEMNSTDAVTVSMWVNKDSAQSGWIALLQHSDESYNLQLNEGTKPAFTIYDSTWNTAYSGITRTNDEWYHVAGTFDEGTAEEYPTVARLMRDVLDHGEVHAKWADSDDKVEVRQGTTTFDFEGEIIVIDDGITDHSFAMNQLVNWEKPMNAFESDLQQGQGQ